MYECGYNHTYYLSSPMPFTVPHKNINCSKYSNECDIKPQCDITYHITSS